MSKRYRDQGERYVQLRFWLLNSPAWQSLPPAARALYIEMVKRYNGSNNGRIFMAVRDAAELICVSKNTAPDRRLAAIRPQLRRPVAIAGRARVRPLPYHGGAPE